MHLAKKGRFKEALAAFSADNAYKKSPTAISYYALCVAVVKKDYEEAVSLCRSAAKKEFYNPDIYLNIGKVCILAERRDLAFMAFKKGLKMDNEHPGLLKQMKQLGIRRRPSLPFLPRGNPFNKLIGALGARIQRPKKA